MEIAHHIINELAKGHQEKLRIDCPAIQKELSPILQQSGFMLVATPPVMIRNAKKNAYTKSNIICSSSTSFWVIKRASLLLGLHVYIVKKGF
ncbi:hypothetical protein [Lysinibacillus boronitolerans]|uniref:hypothetical protein n=1 Tax=Lysinibacillus boronitolerans TaxID=309788 RepID=UPI0002D8D256|nr:hypothetical protein [Lysinibacillus boronitolerans]